MADVFVRPGRVQMATAIARKLRSLRAERGITQLAVAEAIGCGSNLVARWESGKRVPRLGDVLSLARFYRITVDELIGNQVEPIPLEHRLDDAFRAMRQSGISDEVAVGSLRTVIMRWVDEHSVDDPAKAR